MGLTRQRCLWLVAALAGTALAPGQADRRTIPDLIQGLTRNSTWKLVTTIPIGFATHHPQGMVKIGDRFFVSSVEIKTRTKRFANPIGGYDRDTGEGMGHLFQFDSNGKLLADLRLGEGTIYHPGGIDYDGQDIWVPVAEYRPNSRSIIYRVDPETMTSTEVFRFPDHIGAIAHNTDDHTLHGVSWGSRRFYRWTLGADRTVKHASASPEALRTLNPSHYVDYQDCKYVGRQRMLCTGVTEIRPAPEAPPFRLGGIELIDLSAGRPVHQVPLLLWTPTGLSMTQNPAWFEARGGTVTAYFMPEDDRSTLYVYEAEQLELRTKN